MNALYGFVQRADESKLSPELQTNLQLSRRAFGARWRSPASGEKQQVSLVPETEGPNWLLWGGVAAGVGLLGFVAYRYFTRMPT